jgi:hypothetical protein
MEVTNALSYNIKEVIINIKHFIVQVGTLQGRLLALSTYVRPRRKWLAVTNALTYNTAAINVLQYKPEKSLQQLLRML